MAEHTKGPWRTGDVFARKYVFASKTNDDKSCVAMCDTELASEAEQEANARLIAAAPDILAAAQLARSMFLDLERGIAPSRADFAKIEAAIAKAAPPTIGDRHD